MVQENTNIKDMLKFRGLQKSGPQTPLRKFWGTLEDYDASYDERYKRTMVTLKYIDVEVLESTEPYIFPIAQISVKYSDRERSSWGVLADSGLRFLKENEEFKDLKGKRMLMTIGPENFGTNRETGEAIEADCWHIEAVEGVIPAGPPSSGGATAAPMDATERALELLDGKTESEFNQVIFADPIVKQDNTLQQSILSRTFLPAMEAADRATKDENQIWHKK